MSNKRGKQLNKYVPDYVLYDLDFAEYPCEKC